MSSRRIFLQGAMAAGAALACPRLARADGADPAPKAVPYTPIDEIPNHRQLMRDIVIALSDYCRKRRPDMVVLARNAPELLIKGKREWEWELGRDPDGVAQGRYAPEGSLDGPYLAAIDGLLVDGLFYGRDAYEAPTPAQEQAPLIAAIGAVRSQGRHVLSIDYCKEAKHRADAASRARKGGLLAYLDEDGERLLDRVPAAPPSTENSRHVTSLAEARNYLPLMTANGFGRRDRWLEALAGTNYDLLLIDPFFRGSSLTIQEAAALKYKRIGSHRLVMAPLTVGYAAIDRFYWQSGWRIGNPPWIAAADAKEPTRFLTRYWTDGWKAVLGKYVTGLCDLGIDGILLDGLEAYLQFEAMFPI